MAKVGVGLIGSGGRLRGVFSEVLKATQDVEMRALFDPLEASRTAALEQFNPKAVVHDSLDAIVNDPNIDWVMIGSYNCCHAEQVIAAFEAGKHVFCEKPLALSLEDGVAMREAWKKSGKMFTIGFTLRYSPHYRQIKKMIDDGLVGNIISMEFNETLDFNHGGFIHNNWRRKLELAGSHLLEKCSHDVDLTNMMLGSLAMRVASFGNLRFFIPENEKFIEAFGANPENGDIPFDWQKYQTGQAQNPFTADKSILDNQVAILQYANGVNVMFHTNCASAIPERRMYICGDKGTIRADVISGKIDYCKLGWNEKIADYSTNSAGGHGGGDTILGESIAASMLRGEPSVTSINDGLTSAITCFAIDKAQESGTIVDLTDRWKAAGISVD